MTANDSLTHLPFQLTYSRENTAEVPIFEFPIAIADGPPLLTDRLPEGVNLAKKIARHGGLCVVLIHPDVVEPKLGFEKQFVAGVKDFSWFGTMEEFGDWWAARNAIKIESRWRDTNLIVHIDAPLAIDGLTIIAPQGLSPAQGQAIVRSADNQSVVLARLQGGVDIVFARAEKMSGLPPVHKAEGKVMKISAPAGLRPKSPFSKSPKH